ncbi:MAG: DJ-1/PfpI family protein [Planctomycetota bacterium]
MKGMKIEVDKTVDEVNPKDFDCIVFIGGSGAKKLFDNEKILNLAKESVKENKVVAAICLAPSILANAGILEGKNATAFKSEKENLEKKGAKFVNKPVVTDGNLITAESPSDATKFAEAIIECICPDK